MITIRPQTFSMAAPRRILVVGDDRALTERLRAALVADGHLVDVAVSGDDALERLRAPGRPPTMIVLDLDLLDLSGWGLIDILRGEGGLAEVPIAALADGHDRGGLEGVTVFARPLRLEALLAWCAAHALA